MNYIYKYLWTIRTTYL